MFCSNCGYESSNTDEVICPNCGNFMSDGDLDNLQSTVIFGRDETVESKLSNDVISTSELDYKSGLVTNPFGENKPYDIYENQKQSLLEDEPLLYNVKSKGKIRNIVIITISIVSSMIIIWFLIVIIVLKPVFFKEQKLEKQAEQILESDDTDGIQIDNRKDEDEDLNFAESGLDNQEPYMEDETQEQSVEDEYKEIAESDETLETYYIDGYETDNYWKIFNIEILTRELTEEDLYEFTPMELTYLRNSIYARHGYIFKSVELYNFFLNFKEYTPNPYFDASEFTKIEMYNSNFILDYQTTYGLDYKPQ